MHVGDSVRGSDYLEIGEVKQVVEATEAHEAHMVVPQGMIFETDTYIPLDAVTKRAGNTVFVNVPRIVVSKMPWDRPPSRADRAQMHGPPAREVEKLYRSRSPSAHRDSSR